MVVIVIEWIDKFTAGWFSNSKFYEHDFEIALTVINVIYYLLDVPCKISSKLVKNCLVNAEKLMDEDPN